jgi:DNA-binding NarL/FixJ family response regulator
MAQQEKMTIKIPPEARDLVLEVAELLRDSPTFIDRLRNAIEEHQRPSIDAMLQQALERLGSLEQRLEAMDAELQESGGKEFVGPDPSWTTGSGAGKKLTASGEEELFRLFERGLTDKQISRRVGIAISSIAVRRKRYDLERSARSGVN